MQCRTVPVMNDAAAKAKNPTNFIDRPYLRSTLPICPGEHVYERRYVGATRNRERLKSDPELKKSVDASPVKALLVPPQGQFEAISLQFWPGR